MHIFEKKPTIWKNPGKKSGKNRGPRRNLWPLDDDDSDDDDDVAVDDDDDDDDDDSLNNASSQRFAAKCRFIRKSNLKP